MTLRAACFIACVLLASCSDDRERGEEGPPLGPGGTYDEDLRCTPYSSGNGPSTFCEMAQYAHYFQCDAQPGDACVEAPHPSADPNQVAYCCDFPCVRYSVSDYRCLDDRHAYACDQDDPAIADQLGCVDGVDSYIICC